MICLRQLKFAEIENWESLLQEMFAAFEITNKAMSEYIKISMNFSRNIHWQQWKTHLKQKNSVNLNICVEGRGERVL